jgi:hypothetical protein
MLLLEQSKAMTLLGTIKGKQVLILVDSRSSGSFVSKTVADHLALPINIVLEVTMIVADGGM